METKHVFEKDNAIGKVGESLFCRYLHKRGIAYDDVSDNPKYRDIDVDLVVHCATGDVLVEIKNDTQIAHTGNIFYEAISNVDFGTIGCFAKTKADYIVICSVGNSTFHCLETKQIRDFVKENAESLPYISRVGGSNSAGYLISLKRLRLWLENRKTQNTLSL